MTVPVIIIFCQDQYKKCCFNRINIQLAIFIWCLVYSASFSKKISRRPRQWWFERKKKHDLVCVRAAKHCAVGSFSSLLFLRVHSQHWSNLILDLGDQHLGQHDASNLEDRGSHFKLQSTLFCKSNSLRRASKSPPGFLLPHTSLGAEWKHFKMSLGYVTGIHSTVVPNGIISHLSVRPCTFLLSLKAAVWSDWECLKSACGAKQRFLVWCASSDSERWYDCFDRNSPRREQNVHGEAIGLLAGQWSGRAAQRRDNAMWQHLNQFLEQAG